MLKQISPKLAKILEHLDFSNSAKNTRVKFRIDFIRFVLFRDLNSPI